MFSGLKLSGNDKTLINGGDDNEYAIGPLSSDVIEEALNPVIDTTRPETPITRGKVTLNIVRKLPPSDPNPGMISINLLYPSATENNAKTLIRRSDMFFILSLIKVTQSGKVLYRVVVQFYRYISHSVISL